MIGTVGAGGRALSDYYQLRRSTIVDTLAALGFVGGLAAATVLRWSILNVNFRYGNFAAAVFEFAKTMLVWGLAGGVFGLGLGVLAGAVWERAHLRWRRRKEALRPAPGEPPDGPRAPVVRRRSAGASAPTSRGDGPVAARGAAIRYDDAAIPVEAFLGLAERIWPSGYDPARSARAIERTANVGAWDGSHLVGVVRVLTDGYFYATVPEVLVDPRYRGQGIGRELMRRALALSPNGVLLIGATNDSAGFFQRLGCEIAPLGFVMRSNASPPADRRV